MNITSFGSLILLALITAGCNPTGGNLQSKQVNYKLVKNWLQTGKEKQPGQVTGIGVDTSGNIVIFHRADRIWEEPFPDTPISSNTIWTISHETGKLLHEWGTGIFIMPHGLTVDKYNNIWVTDLGLHQVLKFNDSGQLLMKMGVAKTPGNDRLHFNKPTDVTIAADGSFYVSDGYGNTRIVKFSKEGKYLFEWGRAGDDAGAFNTPHGIDVDSFGNVYVADRDNNRIQQFDSNGRFMKQWKNSKSNQLYSIAVDKQTQQVFAIDYKSYFDMIRFGSDLLEFDSSFQLQNRYGRSGNYDGVKCRNHDIAIDKNGDIYLADILVNTVQKFKKVEKE